MAKNLPLRQMLRSHSTSSGQAVAPTVFPICEHLRNLRIKLPLPLRSFVTKNLIQSILLSRQKLFFHSRKSAFIRGSNSLLRFLAVKNLFPADPMHRAGRFQFFRRPRNFPAKHVDHGIAPVHPKTDAC